MPAPRRRPAVNSPARRAVQIAATAVTIICGCGLLIAGFTVPPTGVIDSSVLVGLGELLTFAAAILGIDYHYRFIDNR